LTVTDDYPAYNEIQTFNRDEKMTKSKTVIRMGAAEWSASIPTSDGHLFFDFRKMKKERRREFHREFMNAYRRVTNPKVKAGRKIAT
jgi:hypothetical protein